MNRNALQSASAATGARKEGKAPKKERTLGTSSLRFRVSVESRSVDFSRHTLVIRIRFIALRSR